VERVSRVLQDPSAVQDLKDLVAMMALQDNKETLELEAPLDLKVKQDLQGQQDPWDKLVTEEVLDLPVKRVPWARPAPLATLARMVSKDNKEFKVSQEPLVNLVQMDSQVRQDQLVRGVLLVKLAPWEIQVHKEVSEKLDPTGRSVLLGKRVKQETPDKPEVPVQ
jgi:hypothetical protein